MGSSPKTKSTVTTVELIRSLLTYGVILSYVKIQTLSIDIFYGRLTLIPNSTSYLSFTVDLFPSKLWKHSALFQNPNSISVDCLDQTST